MELEKLLVMIILVETELICESQYLNELDRQFLIDSKNDLLLELEVLHNNTRDAFDKTMNNHFYINERVFGEILLEKIGEIYVSNQLTIHEFGAKMYLIWNSYLPLSIRDEEPFFTLCCADDCLVYGGEDQTRKLYEATFSYYKKDIA